MLSSDLKTMLPSSRLFLMAVNKTLKSDVVDVDCIMFLTPLPGTCILLRCRPWLQNSTEFPCWFISLSVVVAPSSD